MKRTRLQIILDDLWARDPDQNHEVRVWIDKHGKYLATINGLGDLRGRETPEEALKRAIDRVTPVSRAKSTGSTA